MNLLRRWLLPILLVAALVHVTAVLAVPRIVMRIVITRAAAHGGTNTPWHAPPITANARSIPLPSPDLLYSTCVLDLLHGPVLVSVTPGAAYLSLALFDLRTDNVFVTHDAAGDAATGGRPIRVLVMGPGQRTPALPPGITAAHLETHGGLLLLRGLAAAPELARISDQARHTLACVPWRGGAALLNNAAPSSP